MSPELLKGTKITPAVDIYSFGIILWQLKEGKYPYEKITNNDFVVYNVVKKQLRPDTELNGYFLENFEEDLKLCKCNRNKKLLSHFKTEQFLTTNLQKIQEIINLSSSPKLHKPQPKIVITSPENDRKKSIKINLFRKKLFDSKGGQKLRSEIKDFQQMFVHSDQLESSSQEVILNAEMEYVKLYKACWIQEPKDRPNAYKIKEILENCLSKF
jgi:serine/threonine protein kinase